MNKTYVHNHNDLEIFSFLWSPTNQERSMYKEVRCGNTVPLILRLCLTKEYCVKISILFTN